MAPASLFSAWHGFFALLGAAAATLIGAMFVVVSIGMGILSPDRSLAIRTFLTGTVLHLSTVLLGSALTMVPGLDMAVLAVLAALAGIAGVIFSARAMWGFDQHPGTDRSDWYWYVLLPLVAYAALLAVAGLAWRGMAASVDLLAAVLAVLLAAGIRNAWDMIVFFVTRSRDST